MRTLSFAFLLASFAAAPAALAQDSVSVDPADVKVALEDTLCYSISVRRCAGADGAPARGVRNILSGPRSRATWTAASPVTSLGQLRRVAKSVIVGRLFFNIVPAPSFTEARSSRF